MKVEADMNVWMGDDLDFYEECLINLSDEELKEFFRENPEFMEEYHMYEEIRMHCKFFQPQMRGHKHNRYKGRNILFCSL